METSGLQYARTVFPMFKSYYVVWKLDPPVSDDIDTMCLNRTM